MPPRKKVIELPYGRVDARAFPWEDPERCLYLFVNPDGCPYFRPDYERALEERGLLDYVDSVGPNQAHGARLLRLKTAEAKQYVANLRALLVKGLYCAIVDPCLPVACVKVHGVPFHVSKKTVRKIFLPFGAVPEVIREMCPVKELEDVESTTCHVSIYLEDEKKHLPLRRYIGDTEVHMFVPGRRPICLKCGGPQHSRREVCPVMLSFRSSERRPTDNVTSEIDEAVLANFLRLGISHGGSGATPSQPSTSSRH